MEEFESSRRYAAMVDAAAAQTTNFGRGGGDAWAERASHFRLDPHRELDVNTAAVLSLIEPGDTVLDVGGGAGRVALPAALRCRGVVNVDPSAAMRAEFEASAREAGITNAQAIAGNWPEGAPGLAADVGTQLAPTVAPFLYTLNVTVQAPAEPDAVEAALLAEVQRMVEAPVSQAEVAKAIKQTQAEFVYGAESVTDQAYWLGFSEIVASQSWLDSYLERLAAVTPEDVQRVAVTYLQADQRTIGVFLPEELS